MIIIAVLSIAQIGFIKDALAGPTQAFDWPGLDIRNPDGEQLSSATYTFNWLGATGTLMFISGVLTAVALRLNPRHALRAYAATLKQLKWAIVTVAAVLGLAYVMNQSGQTTTLGLWLAGAGSAFAFVSAGLGWLGVAITGSDTSSNALFGALQVTAAKDAGLSPTLMAAANSSGGVLGKMISPQNLAIGAAAVGLAGKEGDVFRRVLGWSLILAAGHVRDRLCCSPRASWTGWWWASRGGRPAVGPHPLIRESSPARSRSRSSNFGTLPVEVLGSSSRNSTALGAL